MEDLLFVYGTLRRGGGHDLEKMIPGARYRNEAVFQGEMALVDYFPGVIDAVQESSRVVGEVYELADGPAALRQLDEFEDVRPENPSAGVYRRERRWVLESPGKMQEVWIYLYNRPMASFLKIESGDFVRFLKQSKTGSME